MKKYYNITVLLMIVAFLPISSMLYGQNINRLYTGNVYVKTYTEVPLTRAQEISKLYDKTYIIPKNELQTIEQGNILYSSPIWHYEEDLNQYTTDNSIILYDLHIPLQTFIEVNELSSRIESIDSIAGTPVIYILSLQNITYEQIDSLCTAFTASSYCKIAEPNYITFGNRVDEITPTTNPYYTYQWGLNNPGGVDINAPEAWNISTGNEIQVIINPLKK